MTQAVFQKVIRRLSRTYGAPTNGDPEAITEEFCKALGGYSESLLERAMDRVIRERTFPGWPTVGEVVDALEHVAALKTVKAPEHVKFTLEPDPNARYVDPDKVKTIVANSLASLHANNDFNAIQARCPPGGTIDILAPWGEEVRDRNGKVVPIREKRKGWAA